MGYSGVEGGDCAVECAVRRGVWDGDGDGDGSVAGAGADVSVDVVGYISVVFGEEMKVDESVLLP